MLKKCVCCRCCCCLLFLCLVIGNYEQVFANETEIPQATDELISEDTASLSEEASTTKELFTQAMEAYQQKHFEQSLELLRQALYKQPRSFQINYWMGKAAYEQGKLSNDLSFFEESVFSYDRAIILKPNHVRAQFEKGRALLALGAKERACKMFQQVAEKTESQSLQNTANHYLKVLKPPSKHSLQGAIILKHEWDSNATLGTELSLPDPLDEELIHDPAEGCDRVHSMALLVLHHVPTWKKNIFWKNQALVYLQDHVKLNDNDLRFFKFSTGLMCCHSKHRVEGDISYSMIYLDERLYRHERDVELKYCYRFSSSLSTKLRYRFTQRHHFAMRGTTKTNTFGMAHFGGLIVDYKPNNCDFFTVQTSVRHSKSPRDYDKPLADYQPKVFLGYTRVLDSKFMVDAGITFRYRYFSYTEPEYSTRKRKDRSKIYHLRLTAKASKKTSFFVETEAEHNISNYANKNYSSKRLSLGTQVLF